MPDKIRCQVESTERKSTAFHYSAALLCTIFFRLRGTSGCGFSLAKVPPWEEKLECSPTPPPPKCNILYSHHWVNDRFVHWCDGMASLLSALNQESPCFDFHCSHEPPRGLWIKLLRLNHILAIRVMPVHLAVGLQGFHQHTVMWSVLEYLIAAYKNFPLTNLRL